MHYIYLDEKTGKFISYINFLINMERAESDSGAYYEALITGYMLGVLRRGIGGFPDVVGSILSKARESNLIQGDKLKLTAIVQKELEKKGSKYNMGEILQRLPCVEPTGDEINYLDGIVKGVESQEALRVSQGPLHDFVYKDIGYFVFGKLSIKSKDDDENIGLPVMLAAIFLYNKKNKEKSDLNS